MSSIGNNYTPFYVTDADLEPGLKNRATALSYMSNRNRIINGGMAVDQRNAGASTSVPTTGAYTLDRWLVTPAGAAVNVQRSGTAAAYSLQVTGAASVTQVDVQQRIEAANVADLAGRTVTLSAVLSSTSVTSVQVRYLVPGTPDLFTSVTSTPVATQSISAVATRYSWSFTLPAGAAAGLAVSFVVPSLTTGLFSITNVQLEEGSVATAFERKLLSQELSLCQRYFWSLPGGIQLQASAQPPGTGWVVQQYVTFPVTMRAAPTVTAVFSSPVNILSQGVQSISAAGFQPWAASASASVYSSVYSAGNTASAEL